MPNPLLDAYALMTIEECDEPYRIILGGTRTNPTMRILHVPCQQTSNEFINIYVSTLVTWIGHHHLYCKKTADKIKSD